MGEVKKSAGGTLDAPEKGVTVRAWERRASYRRICRIHLRVRRIGLCRFERLRSFKPSALPEVPDCRKGVNTLRLPHLLECSVQTSNPKSLDSFSHPKKSSEDNHCSLP